VVVRFGRVSRGRLAAAASVTGTLALFVIGPARAAGGLLADVHALAQVPLPPGPSWAVLETLAAVLWRGIGVAAITVPTGVLAAVFDNKPGASERCNPGVAGGRAAPPRTGRGPHPPPR
jgi:hypothetical protein